jgi:hypothetical protein
MSHSQPLRMSSRMTAIAVLCAATLNAAGALAAQDVAVPAFRSVAARNGAHVVLRHGEQRRVTIIRGNTTTSVIRVEEKDRLVIDRCPDGCSRDYRLEVEIVAPEITGLSVSDGGRFRCVGTFPSQADVAAAVSNGGVLDLRAMNANDVSAAIHQGGRILTTPRQALSAAIAQGGVITYWGNPDVSQSIEHGGAVSRGKPADRDRPLDASGAVGD